MDKTIQEHVCLLVLDILASQIIWLEFVDNFAKIYLIGLHLQILQLWVVWKCAPVAIIWKILLINVENNAWQVMLIITVDFVC
jgi:hypothetical protein